MPDHPIIPFIRGDGTGPDIWAASVRVFDAAVEKAYGGKKKISWFEVFAGQAAKDKFDQLAAGRHGRSVSRISRRHQRSADHAGRRRDSLAQCRAAPDARSLRLPAPGAIFQGRPLAREASGESRHGDLPRKHRGHLRRHRMGRGHAGVAEGPRFPREGISEGVRQDPLRHKGEGGGVLEKSRRAGKATTSWSASASSR